ncbi:Long chain acyl-CoA synthetase 7 peroxisomal [Physocladia obscura]|uniref:Long chain acyl-CoA synthetase 7 peroxisomal n=1 Tax=Physocladia obscura TaxID=109957 RepID=A0AAD5SRU6_9FUNG|nr:Long chain acyl-CoA synthetase 7 peroxisomal [Physocladia obscura]
MGKIPTVTYEALGVTTLDRERIHELRAYAKELPGTAPVDGSSTGIYRNVQALDGLHIDFPRVKTLHDIFQAGLRVNAKGNCLGWRPVYYDYEAQAVKAKDYVWLTYEQVNERIKAFGNGLVKIHKDLSGSDNRFNFGVYSINNPEYVIADYGCHLFSLALVALYDTLGEETSEYILNHAEVPIIATTLDKIEKLIKLAPKCPKLKAVILMDGNLAKSNEFSASVNIGKQGLLAFGIKLFLFSEVEEIGKKNFITPRLPRPEDPCAISYTSGGNFFVSLSKLLICLFLGTTGTPKGAIILHKNVVAFIRGEYDVGLSPFDTTDVYISYLPLAHIYEKGNINASLVHGAAVGFYRGDTALLLEDIAALKPTIFCSVPRLLNRIYERIIIGAESGSAFKKSLFQRAVDAKLANYKASGQLTHAFWDRLVFSKVQQLLGGRIRFIASGSAPISGDVLIFLKIAFSCPVTNGLGQTESAAGTSIALPKDRDVGHAGPPISCNEVKLVSVPEMRYTASDKPFPRGEIWIRGGNVFGGYFKDEEKTKETITKDGWLKTGDIGYIDKKGRIYVVDRKKNIFKLAQGEYVAPEKIENAYQKCNLASQIYVHGDSLQAELVAIVVPDAEFVIPLAREHGILPASTPNPGPTVPNAPPHPLLKSLAQNEKIKELILQDLNKVGKEQGLKGFEFAKAIHLDVEGFSGENGLLTPTFKLKRNEVAEKFRPVIDALYKVLNDKAVKGKI